MTGGNWLQDASALIAAVTALVIAATGFASVFVVLYRIKRNLDTNTELTTLTAVTSESTHQIVNGMSNGPTVESSSQSRSTP